MKRRKDQNMKLKHLMLLIVMAISRATANEVSSPGPKPNVLFIRH